MSDSSAFEIFGARMASGTVVSHVDSQPSRSMKALSVAGRHYTGHIVSAGEELAEAIDRRLVVLSSRQPLDRH